MCVVDLLDTTKASERSVRKFVMDCIEGDGRGLRLAGMHVSGERFSPQNGLLTPNLKVNRPALRRRFGVDDDALSGANHG